MGGGTEVDIALSVASGLVIAMIINTAPTAAQKWMVMGMAEYKDITELKKQIADFKKAAHSPNGDYLTGYVCALSATEGIIAGLPDADVVEVVRCKDCKWYAPNNEGSWIGCAFDTRHPDDVPKVDDFCSYGERKDNG
jgi:hypothetical protein